MCLHSRRGRAFFAMAQLVLLAPGAAMPAKHLIELPADVLGHILVHLPLYRSA